ncbi:hypothetical protein [Clostridium sp.]|uniref:hypothetical protein n=1 Tax=Clostridium sp. TaxID=1506 RepID=UPI0026216B35|nr:hypothetical protein [Clostridium sp.]
MNIEKLKNDFIEKKNKEEEIERIKKLIIHQFDFLINIDTKIMEECESKCLDASINFNKEFVSYFNKNGFKIFEGNPIIADFNGLEILLLKLDSKKNEVRYRLTIDKKKEFYIKLRIANRFWDIISWKYVVQGEQDLIVDKKNGIATIHSCNEIKKLENISRFLSSKRKELNNLLNGVNPDLFKYVYTTFMEDKVGFNDEAEYDTFKELFESL